MTGIIVLTTETYKKIGSTPIKLVENRSRAARFADWSLSHCSNRHNHRGWLLLRKTRFSGVSPRRYVKDAIKHGQDGRGTLYLIFRNIDSRLCQNMPEAIKR